jgi:hypothetical protein
MDLNYIENNNFFTKKEIKIINADILGNMFPWYLHPKPTTDKFIFMSHTLIKRNEDKINSNVFDFFANIFARFTYKNNIKCKKITRASLNLTFSDNRYIYSDPHVDYKTPHFVCIMYLNNTEGSTFIFDKKFKNGPEYYPIEKIKNLKILKESKPKQGKIVNFNGNYYHANSFCKEGKFRVVLVLTYI